MLVQAALEHNNNNNNNGTTPASSSPQPMVRNAHHANRKPQTAEEKLNQAWEHLNNKNNKQGGLPEEEAQQQQEIPAACPFHPSKKHSPEETESDSSDDTMATTGTTASETTTETTTTTTKQPREWPSYDAVMAGVANADYNEILKCPIDFKTRTETDAKTLAPHGVVCRAKLELFPAPPPEDNGTTAAANYYTGMLAPGTTWDHCLLRLSSVMQPPNQAIQSTWARSLLYATGQKIRNAQIFPGSALKVFTNDDDDSNGNNNITSSNNMTSNNSRNLLFGGSKVGQRETDYFAHCQCTSLTERMPSTVKPFVRKFWEYSKYPLSLGVSDFCKPVWKEEDEEDGEINFPFALILKPMIRSEPQNNKTADAEGSDSGSDDNGEDATTTAPPNEKNSKQRKWWFGRGGGNTEDTTKTTTTTGTNSSFDSFLDFSLSSIPKGTALFEIYACPTPHDVADASKLQRIGRIVTTSTFIESTPNDGLFFKHQAKEDDYALRPDWPAALADSVTLVEGKATIKGSVGTLAGWQLFEQQIGKEEYVDFGASQTQ